VTTVTVATWNVNSLKARMQHLLEWIQESPTDIILLQETKCEDVNFPVMEIESAGYNLAFHGQKSYNGVAILSKYPIDEVIRGLPGNEDDPQARYIESVISLPETAIRVASVYVPNGNEVGSEKFQHKMRFFERLNTHLTSLFPAEEAVIIGGDFNVGAFAQDVYDPKRLDGTVCYHADERAHMRTILNAGWRDTWREMHPAQQQFSWWDYRGGAYQRGHGLRIDYLLSNPVATDAMQDCVIDESPRRKEKPSDHTPVVVTLSL
jgi:exodeoxyribonuclease-3